MLATLLALAAAPIESAGAGALGTLEDEQVALFERIANAVVVISHGGTVGTGFGVAPGLVLTAAHVVAGAAEVEVTLRDGRTLRGGVLTGTGAGTDLALVRLPPASLATLALSPVSRPRTGSVVATVGHGDGNRWSFATGMVSNAEADGPGGALLRLQLPLRPGASGGPVVDRAGRVVGMITTGGPGVAFAVRAPVILGALKGLAPPGPPPTPEEVAELGWSPGEPLTTPRPIVGPADPRPATPPERAAGSARTPKARRRGAARPEPVEGRTDQAAPLRPTP